MATDKEILDYLQRAQDDPDLDDRVQVDGGMAEETRLRAHLRRGAQGDRPDPLVCDYGLIQRLIAQGRVSYRRRRGAALRRAALAAQSPQAQVRSPLMVKG